MFITQSSRVPEMRWRWSQIIIDFFLQKYFTHSEKLAMLHDKQQKER